MMRDAIGYPDYIMNDTALNGEYAGVSVTQHIENILCTFFRMKATVFPLTKPVMTETNDAIRRYLA